MGDKKEDVGEPDVKKQKTDGSEVSRAEGVPETVMQLTEWTERWEKRQIGFHRERVNDGLEKHADRFLDGQEKLRIFIPLCGKSVDIRWLADKGHQVVGVEVSEQAIKEFFDEQKLEYSAEGVDQFDGKVFKSQDDQIRLYCGDLFKFTKAIEGGFNRIWDRGSLVAINRDDREKYSELLMSLMAKDCVYMVSCLVYDQAKYGGPPHCTTFEEVTALYGSKCTVEEIDSFDALEEKHKEWELDSLQEIILLVKPKQ